MRVTGYTNQSQQPQQPQPRPLIVKEGQQVVANPTPFRVTPASQATIPAPRPKN